MKLSLTLFLLIGTLVIAGTYAVPARTRRSAGGYGNWPTPPWLTANIINCFTPCFAGGIPNWQCFDGCTPLLPLDVQIQIQQIREENGYF